MPSGPSGSRREYATAVLLSVWVAVLSTLAGYAQTDGQRLAALALVTLTAGLPAVAAKRTGSMQLSAQ